MPKPSPLQIAQEQLREAEAELQSKNDAATKLERRKSRLSHDIKKIEADRKSVAVLATGGDASAKSRFNELAGKRTELINELELVETAIPDLQEQIEGATRLRDEAEVEVAAAQKAISAEELTLCGAEVDSALVTLSAAMAKFISRVSALEALASNSNPLLATENTIIGETVHRLRGPALFHAAVANVRDLPRQINLGEGVAPSDIKPLSIAASELLRSILRRR